MALTPEPVGKCSNNILHQNGPLRKGRTPGWQDAAPTTWLVSIAIAVRSWIMRRFKASVRMADDYAGMAEIIVVIRR